MFIVTPDLWGSNPTSASICCFPMEWLNHQHINPIECMGLLLVYLPTAKNYCWHIYIYLLLTLKVNQENVPISSKGCCFSKPKGCCFSAPLTIHDPHPLEDAGRYFRFVPWKHVLGFLMSILLRASTCCASWVWSNLLLQRCTAGETDHPLKLKLVFTRISTCLVLVGNSYKPEWLESAGCSWDIYTLGN